MKYILVCKDNYGNVLEKSFSSWEERNDFLMRYRVQVLFTKEEY